MATQTGDLKDLKDVGKKDSEPAKKPDTPTDAGKTPPQPTSDKGTTPPAPTEDKTPPAPVTGVTPTAPKKPIPAKGTDARGQFLSQKFVAQHNQDKEDRAIALEKLKQEAAGTKDGKTDGGTGKETEKQDPGTGGTVQTTNQNGGAGYAGAGNGGAEKEKRSMSDVMDSIFEVTDPLADIAGMAATHASDGISLYGDAMGVKDKEASTASDIAGTITSGSSMLLNTYGTIRSGMETHKARTSGDKVGYRSGIFNTIGSAFGTMGDMGTFGTAVGSAADGSDKSGDIGNVIAGFMGAVGSISSMIGSSYSTHKYRTGRNNLNARAAGAAGTDMAKLDAAKNDALQNGDLNAFNAARTERSTAKAKKYASAMGGAAADTKYKAGAWDTLGNVAGLVGGLASLVGGSIGLGKASPIAKLVMTGIGALSNIVGSVAKTKNMISEKKRGSENKTKFVAEYIGEKKKKILTEANDGVTDENEKVTEAEAENIAIARLGINADKPIAETSTLAQNRDAIFDILAKKRAQNIMQADNATRTAILQDMGLDPTKATEDAIVSALGG